MGLMALIAFINVLGRYFFHYSLAFTEEVTIHLFVMVVVIGSGIAFERSAHMGMTSLFRFFPRPAQKGIAVLSAALATASFSIVDLYLIRAIYYEITLFKARSAALDIPVWWYQAGVIACTFFVYRGILRGLQSSFRITPNPNHNPNHNSSGELN
jgi:TRAP-type C4-dicarboxylate transport system permease small subunit